MAVFRDKCDHCSVKVDIDRDNLVVDEVLRTYYFECPLCEQMNVKPASGSLLDVIMIHKSLGQVVVPEPVSIEDLLEDVSNLDDKFVSLQGVLEILRAAAATSAALQESVSEELTDDREHAYYTWLLQLGLTKAVEPVMWAAVKVKIRGKKKPVQGIILGTQMYIDTGEVLLALGTSKRESKQVQVSLIAVTDIKSLKVDS